MTLQRYFLRIYSILCWLVLIGSILFLFLSLASAVRAGEPSPVLQDRTYGPPRYVAFVADLNAPAVIVPVEFAVQAVSVITCESRWNTEAVGKAGERGLLQIHPIHFGTMRELGLDPYSERDRLLFAVRLWEDSGRTWRHWACQHTLEGAH